MSVAVVVVVVVDLDGDGDGEVDATGDKTIPTAGRYSANRSKIARCEAMECTASLDVMKRRKVLTDARYERGGHLLEGVSRC